MDMHLRNLQKKRTANFREEETKLLIELWGSPIIQNKLFLTHRKAPVMRILAANMQQRGFYRTPDEIKTRIRNLKCLYHRIKRTMSCGTGIGTVDPDWPHFKAMDAILSKENSRKLENMNTPEDSLLEGPKCEDIKQEIVEIDIHDDMESMATNDSLGSEYGETPSPPPLKPAPNDQETSKDNSKQQIQKQLKLQQVLNKKLPRLAPNFTMPTSTFQLNQTNSTTNNNSNNVRPNMSSIPLLILNSLPQQNQDKDTNQPGTNTTNDKDINNKLKELIDIQTEKLKVEQKRLNLEKQRLDFDRLVGAQLLTLIPMVGELIKQLSTNTELFDNKGENSQDNNKRKRINNHNNKDINGKYLKSMIQDRIKKYIMGDNESEEDEEDREDSDNEDVDIINENSNASEK